MSPRLAPIRPEAERESEKMEKKWRFDMALKLQ